MFLASWKWRRRCQRRCHQSIRTARTIDPRESVTSSDFANLRSRLSVYISVGCFEDRRLDKGSTFLVRVLVAYLWSCYSLRPHGSPTTASSRCHAPAGVPRRSHMSAGEPHIGLRIYLTCSIPGMEPNGTCDGTALAVSFSMMNQRCRHHESSSHINCCERPRVKSPILFVARRRYYIAIVHNSGCVVHDKTFIPRISRIHGLQRRHFFQSTSFLS